MKTKIIILFIFLFLAGCKKDDIDNYRPEITDSTTINSGLKVSATGKILSVTVNNTYRTGLKLNLSNTVTLKINVYTIGTYNIISNNCNGIIFTKSGIFTYKGIQDVILYGNGTPINIGVNSFNILFGNGFSFNVVVVNNNPISQISCNKTYTYMQVANHKTQRVWLDRNLGSSQVALSSIDYLSYGSLYQWGRLTDGHQCITWSNSYNGVGLNSTTNIRSVTDVPNHSNYIKQYSDWRNPLNNNLWQGISGINNPCPSGYRIPTSDEMNIEKTSWNTQNSSGGFNNPLKWVTSGYREYYDSEIYDAGNVGGYWTSTISNTTKSKVLWFSPNESIITDDFRSEGYSVRCIKN